MRPRAARREHGSIRTASLLTEGSILLPPLRERLRTRFGNLWYREAAAGRMIREAAEPGGSVLAAEIAAGLSIPEAGAEWLVETWQ